MKIAIFSGVIPSTTFVEHLIEMIAKNHEIYLFGQIQNSVNYNTETIKIFGNSKSIVKNLFIALYRFFLLVFCYPQRVRILYSEVQKHTSIYNKRAVFLRVLPVVLYKPDIFHIQWAKDIDQWMFLKDKMNVKVVLSLRGAHINYSPIASAALAGKYRLNFPNIDAFHAVSNAISKEAQKYNAEEKRIKVIHSPIKEMTFNYYSKFVKSTESSIKLCAVGRFHWIKGYEYLINACKILKNNGVDFHLLIVASNTIPEQILYQIHELKLNEEISIKHNLSHKKLFSIMKDQDILVLPSLKEGIANAVLEAMAIGLPVIATNCGGMAEVVKHEETGWLTPIRDPQSIADTIISVSQKSEDQLNVVTKNAHDFVKKHFNPLYSCQKFENLYQSLFD